MMNWKTLGAVLGATIITFLATYFMTAGQAVVEAGVEAQFKDDIREVLREEMIVMIDGEVKTYGQVLSSLHTQVTAQGAVLDILVEE